jgi:hypothetical protein
MGRQPGKPGLAMSAMLDWYGFLLPWSSTLGHENSLATVFIKFYNYQKYPWKIL